MVDMSLNIKNPRVHALARELANRTGRSQTSVIEEALTRMLDDDARPVTMDRRARVDRLLADIDARLTDEDRAEIRAVELYDDVGLPT